MAYVENQNVRAQGIQPCHLSFCKQDTETRGVEVSSSFRARNSCVGSLPSTLVDSAPFQGSLQYSCCLSSMVSFILAVSFSRLCWCCCRCIFQGWEQMQRVGPWPR